MLNSATKEKTDSLKGLQQKYIILSWIFKKKEENSDLPLQAMQGWTCINHNRREFMNCKNNNNPRCVPGWKWGKVYFQQMMPEHTGTHFLFGHNLFTDYFCTISALKETGLVVSPEGLFLTSVWAELDCAICQVFYLQGALGTFLKFPVTAGIPLHMLAYKVTCPLGHRRRGVQYLPSGRLEMNLK